MSIWRTSLFSSPLSLMLKNKVTKKFLGYLVTNSSIVVAFTRDDIKFHSTIQILTLSI